MVTTPPGTVPDNQGLVVQFDGVTLGKVTNVACDGGSVAMVDTTPINCTVVGAGLSARAIMEEHPGNVTKGTVQVNFLGPQPLSVDDEGRFGRLVVTWKGGNVDSFATLSAFAMTGTVNDVVRGSATWKLTG